MTQDRPAHQARPAKLDAATKRKVLFNKILAKSEQFALAQQRMEPILNEYAWDALLCRDSMALNLHEVASYTITPTSLG